MTDMAKLSIEASTKGVKQSTDDLKRLETQSKKTESASKGVENATKAVTDAQRKASHGMRQTALQLSQVAQQGSVTGNYIQALAIQLPDLAIGFGTLGIAAGAVLGVLGSFVPNLFAATDHTENLADAVDYLDSVMVRADDGTRGLTKRIRELAKVSQVAANIEIQRGIIESTAAASEAILAMRDIVDDELDTTVLGDIQLAIGAASNAYKEGTTLAEEFAKAQNFHSPGLYEFNKGLNTVRAEMENLSAEFGISEESARDMIQAIAAAEIDPTVDNFRELQTALFNAQKSSDDVGVEFSRFASTLSNLANESIAAKEKGELLSKWLDDFSSAKTQEELNDASRSAAAFKREIQSLIEGVDPLAKISDVIVKVNRAIEEGLEESLGQDIIEDHFEKAFGKASDAGIKEMERLERKLNSLLDRADPLEKLGKTVMDVNAGIAAGFISEEEGRTILDQAFDDAFGVGKKAGKEAAKAFKNPWNDTAKGVSQSLQNAIASGDWSSLGDGIGNALAGSASAILSKTITDSLSDGLTQNSSALSQIAGAFAGPIAGAVVGGLVQLAVKELSDYFSDDYDPTEARQAAQGTGTVLGSVDAKSESIKRAVEGSESGIGQLVGINRAMLDSLNRVNAGIVGASGIVARSEGVQIAGPSVMTGSEFLASANAAGMAAASSYVGAFGPMFALSIIDSKLAEKTAGVYLDYLSFALTGGLVDFGKLLGGKTKLKDQGIRIIGGTLSDLLDETVVDAYSTFRSKKHAFDDYDTYERFSRLGDDVGKQFSLVFESLFDTVLASAEMLGVDAEQSLLDFNVSTRKLSLEGLSAERKQEELEAYFSKIFDEMASAAIPFLEEFQKAGEGVGETLNRLGNYVAITEESIYRLGIQFQELSGRELVEASERLIEFGGGIESFVSGMQGFISNFASEARQLELANSDLNRALAMIGLTLPETRAGYFDLVQAQDGSTEAGAANIATLLRLQSVAHDYYEMLEDASTDVFNELTQTFGALGNAMRSLYGASEQFLGATRKNAVEFLRETVSSGNVRYTDELGRALSDASKVDKSQFSTFADYMTEVATTGALIQQLQGMTAQQMGVDEKTLDAINNGNSDIVSSLAQINQTLGGGSISLSSPVSLPASVKNTQDDEIKKLKEEVVMLNKTIAINTAKTAKILDRMDRNGILVRAE